jgi:hypothetical protein
MHPRNVISETQPMPGATEKSVLSCQVTHVKEAVQHLKTCVSPGAGTVSKQQKKNVMMATMIPRMDAVLPANWNQVGLVRQTCKELQQTIVT